MIGLRATSELVCEFLMLVIKKIVAVWDVTPVVFVDGY